MDTFDAIEKRVSIRKYQSKPVERGLLEKLVDAARRAPTARKVEPWEFIVITDKTSLKRIGEMADNGAFIKDAPCCIAVFCEDTKYYLEDGCAATENMLIQATDLGLGSCWVAGDKKDYAPKISDLLGVPPQFKLISLIALGWGDEEKKQSRNRSLEEVIHWEKF